MKQFYTSHKLAFAFLKKYAFLRHKSYFVWSFFALFSSSIIGVLIPILAKMELDQLSLKSSHLWGISFSSPIFLFSIILGATLFVSILSSILDFLFGLRTTIQKQILSFELKKEIFLQLSTIDPGFTMMNRFRRMIGSVSGSVHSLPSKIEDLLKGYVGGGIEFISIALVTSFFDIRIFFAVVFLGIVNYKISIFSEYFKRKYEISSNYELDWEVRNIEYELEDSYQYIVSHGGVDMLFDRFISLKKQQIESLKIREKINFWTRIAEQLSSEIVSLGIKLFVGYLIFVGTESLGLMVLVTLYMGRMTTIINQFFSAFTQKYELSEDISILEFFLDFISEKTRKRNLGISDTSEFLEIQKLNFSYPKPAESEIRFLDIKIETLKKLSKKDNSAYIIEEIDTYQEAKNEAQEKKSKILKDINISFRKGRLYGIVGRNGAGKTTLTSLLLGFFGEYDGSILLDGKELSHIHRDDIQKNIGYVSQEPYIMYGRFSIRDNLTLGVKREVSDEELYKYLSLFDLKEKILKQREGLNTRLKWDIDLSGGQKQILSLIRVILQDRSILILDEGTNQLDSENEMKVMNELLRNKQDRIIIFVTHRMNTMKKCDFIYVLKNGEIEDSGKPGDLARRKNDFSHFIHLGEQNF